MTALTIITKATARLGITTPTAVFSSTDDQIIQLRTLMNEEGEELGKAYPWTVLLTEKTFTTTAAAIQTSAVPTDFGWYMNDTLWNRTLSIRYGGPASSEEWQRYQASVTPIALPNGVFRFQGGNLLIYPPPTASQTAAYEYVSKYWAATAAGNAGTLAAMTADTDVSLLDENVISLGVRWRFLAAKGMDYAETFRSYELQKAQAIARDGGRRKHSLSGGSRPQYNGNIPDGSWNQ